MSHVTNAMGNPTEDKHNSFPKFKLKLPMFGLGQKEAEVGEMERRGRTKADVVRFSEPKPATPSPLKLELEETPIPNRLIVWPNGQNKAELKATKPAEKDGEGETTQRPNIVTFPNYPGQIVTPLESEFEESSGTSHNPVIIWQVYALGGFIILKWIWLRWKERNERAKKPSSDDDLFHEDYQSTTGDE